METGAALAVGSGGGVRPSPFALPVHFVARDATADGRTRDVQIDRDRVVLRRRVAGIAMRLALPIEAYLGVALMLPRESAGSRLTLVLAHRDPGLTVVLAEAEPADAVADWRAWARTLACPLLVENDDGTWHELALRLGAVSVETPCPRRRRCSPHAARRPKALMRRKPGVVARMAIVHRGEREIIART